MQQPWPPNGLELSCRAAQATGHSFSRILAGKTRPNFPPASRVSCSELLGGRMGPLARAIVPAQGCQLGNDPPGGSGTSVRSPLPSAPTIRM
jgi:hypothetical protein